MKKLTGARIIKLDCPYARYVSLRSVEDTSVVAHGNNLAVVLEKTKKAGVLEPFIVFPHDPSKKYIY